MKNKKEECCYCKEQFDTREEFLKHLNKKHTKCLCGTVFDSREDGYALCDKCIKEGRW